MITVLKIIGYREEPEFIQIRQFETIEEAQEYIENNDKQGKYFHKCFIVSDFKQGKYYHKSFIVSNFNEIDLQTLEKSLV